MPREKSPQAKLLEDVKSRFQVHDAHPAMDQVRADLGRVAQKLAKMLPVSREQSLALTKLEEAMYHANAALARHPQDVASSDVPAEPKKTAKKTTRRVTRTART